MLWILPTEHMNSGGREEGEEKEGEGKEGEGEEAYSTPTPIIWKMNTETFNGNRFQVI